MDVGELLSFKVNYFGQDAREDGVSISVFEH